MALTIETVAGDSAPDVTFVCSREDGSVIDITGSTVRFKIQDFKTKLRNNDSPKVNTCAILNGVEGLCVYSWNTGGTDCPHPGTYRAVLEITYPNGKRESIQARVEAAEGV